ncbi:MAG TPA: OsmC family protein [Terriglobales bacterium]|nr:OsmC family protein [Terriglobales bacterium]
MSEITEAKAEWAGELRFATNGSSGHALTLDSARGANTAPGPMEMVLRSLCACSATDVAIVLNKARQGLTRLEVTAQGERAPQAPAVYTKIHLVYRIAGTTLQAEVAERAVMLSQTKYCSVYLMLSPTVRISHEIVLEPVAK